MAVTVDVDASEREEYRFRCWYGRCDIEWFVPAWDFEDADQLCPACGVSGKYEGRSFR